MIQIKFGTDGWRAIIAKEFTTDNVARVAKATADWVKQNNNNPSVVIGHDCRFAGELFAEVTAKVLCSEGVKVFIAKDFVSTPMVSYGANQLNAVAGVVITASHNPPSYNGFKLKSGYGGPSIPEDIAIVESLIPNEFATPSTSLEEFEKNGMLQWVNLEDMYFDHVQKSFDLNTINNSGIKLGYDAMYGAGQRVIKRILKNIVALHCDDNPGFHGQAPEPIHRNLMELSELVKNDNSLMGGLANDGDADRIGMYDENGNFVDSHHIILLLIHYLHKYKNYNGKVVIAFSVSDKVKRLCEHYKLDYEVTKIGFKYICGKMVTEDVLVGGEESGGIAVKGHVPERDGIWCGLLLMEFMAKTGKKLTELILEVYDIVGSFYFDRNDLHIEDQLKNKIVDNCRHGVYKSFGNYTVRNMEDIDGYKFHLSDNSWVMIRASGTEPLLRVYAEAYDKNEADKILDTVKKVLIG
ncbi:MAG: phosphoglucomutase/phosphomannomutase family protein [Fimbriimonadaceae bacterium]|nr:phosphoglucomutase/phosphomannomutase family protein [Chitinophagales bacterium]